MKRNLDEGMSLRQALTTDIDPMKIVRSAQTGEFAYLTAAAVMAAPISL